MDKIVEKFKNLLDDTTKSEQDYQDFIEINSKIFNPPFIQNHDIHFEVLISKFPLDTSITTDLAYLTKSSIRWWIVLVELESPHNKLFTKSGKPSQKLKDAIAQVDEWKNFVHRNSAEVIRRTNPIRQPLSKNKVYFKYALIIGRNNELVNNQKNIDMLDALQRNDLKICTYDTLINSFNHRSTTRNIVRIEREKFAFKYMHRSPTNMFCYLTPEQITLTPEQKKQLIADGYEIEKWENGTCQYFWDNFPKEFTHLLTFC